MIILIFSLISLSNYCQSLDSIKHIEIISEIQDSMALLNKQDIDKINEVFYDLRIADSLNTINESIISNLLVKNNKLDSIMRSQKVIIENESLIRNQIILNHNSEIDFYKKELRKANNKKIVWQSTTGISLLAIILIIVL